MSGPQFRGRAIRWRGPRYQAPASKVIPESVRLPDSVRVENRFYTIPEVRDLGLYRPVVFRAPLVDVETEPLAQLPDVPEFAIVLIRPQVCDVYRGIDRLLSTGSDVDVRDHVTARSGQEDRQVIRFNQRQTERRARLVGVLSGRRVRRSAARVSSVY